ncbi:MAG: aminopeptidase, partial [Algicola sp.]|nr:aminopeptidase [Algicola sp.]
MNTFSFRWLLRFLGLGLGFGLLVGCGGSSAPKYRDIETGEPVFFIDLLNQIESVSADLYVSPVDGYQYYKLTVEQPIDHNDPNSPTFSQRVRLLMHDENAPIILQTRGYAMAGESRLALDDLSTMIGANQIEVEHRYFGESIPATTDWSTMTIAQAAADHHAIIAKLKPLFTGNWIATGRSKGGMTATYLKRFYPGDLAGVVAYVAPLSLSMWDERFADYSVSVVDETCRLKFETYQRQALLRIDELA